MKIYEKKCKEEIIHYADGVATHGWMLKVHYPFDTQNRRGKTTIVKVTGDELISRGYKLVEQTA